MISSDDDSDGAGDGVDGDGDGDVDGELALAANLLGRTGCADILRLVVLASIWSHASARSRYSPASSSR